MPTILDQLGQARPSDTDPAVLFSTEAGETKIILGLTVANGSGAEAETFTADGAVQS